VAPHPDDEVLVAGALMRRHGDVVVVAVTDGEASHARSRAITPDELRVRRAAEREEALRRLEVAPCAIVRLGAPDQGGGEHVAEIAAAVASVLRRGDLVVTVSSADPHPDHLATAKAVRRADTKLWTTAPLNLWTASGGDADMVGEIESSRQVLVTGRQAGERVEIVVEGKSRWVTDGYLSEDKPVELGVGAGLSMAPCPHSGESGLTSAAVLVFRSVCHAFPQITTYGGWSNHGEHASGRAIDIMTSDVALGTAIAEFLRSHASELHLYDVLWRQHIWTPVRAGEGWRYMSSRGSTTANHYDHVHVSVY